MITETNGCLKSLRSLPSYRVLQTAFHWCLLAGNMQMNANLSGTSQLFHWVTYQFEGGKHLLALINQSYFQPRVRLDG